MSTLHRFSLVGCLLTAFSLAGCPGPSPDRDTGPGGDVGPTDTGPRPDGGDAGPTDAPIPTDTPVTPDTPAECTVATDCPAPTDGCRVATCTGGMCGEENAADGTTCDDADACTDTDVCTAGVCGGAAITCTASGMCMVASCDPATGCSEAPVADGTACDDGDLCTLTDTCAAGACAPGTPVMCADDECDIEMCNPATGMCDLTPEAAGTTCMSVMGGTCDGAGTCGCSATELTCGGTCFATGACTVGVGACAASGSLICDAGGMAATSCDAVAGMPGTETCNNVDDDCDGTVDLPSFSCYSGPAGTAGVGICAAGTSTCTGGTSGACTGEVLPGTEICGNGIDEDCDGADLACNPDNCASAPSIALDADGVTVTGTTAGSTNSTPSCSSGTGDHFYAFTLTARSIVYVDSFGSGYDTIVGIADTCAATPTCVDDACGALQSQVTAILDPGTHFIVVDGFLGATGAYTLRVQAVAVSGTPTALAAGMSTWTGTTVGAPSVTTTSCGGSGPELHRFWTTCPAATAGTLTASTCTTSTWDTILAVRNGDGTQSCNDDSCGAQSDLSATIPAGAGLHVLTIDGFGGASGTFSIPVSRP